jgi:methyl-accepting chemotaxis protein
MSRLLRRPPVPAASEVTQVKADIVATALHDMPAVCEVADAHLHDVIEQTGEAAESIVEQMIKVDALAETMAADVVRLAGTLGRTESELGQATLTNDQLWDRLIRYFLYRDQQIQGLVNEMRDLKQHVGQIEEVSKATNILALNAMIEAVRAGDKGEGFAVVADEVRKLADRSARAANDIGTNIADLTARLDAVLSDDSQFDRDSGGLDLRSQDNAITRRLSGIAKAQREMSELVERVLHDTMAALHQVEQSSGALTAETTGAVGHVQFQDITRQMLEHVAEAIGEMRSGTENLLGYVKGETPESAVLGSTVSVEQLRNRHVMARQRVTHEQHTGGAVTSDDAPVIELF